MKTVGYVITDKPDGGLHICNCIGPQNGQPVCPCRMRGVTEENGRYVEKRDLGPVPKPQYLDEFQQQMARVFDDV